MRFLSSDYIFPVSSPPVRNGVLVVDTNGKILELYGKEHNLPVEKIEKYRGFICPGFINTHCHLELSFLKGKIKEKTGIIGFIKELIANRNRSSSEEILQAIKDAEQEMICNGIVAVGDISNDNFSFKQKSYGNLRYHTFIELLAIHPDKADIAFERGKKLMEEYRGINQGGSCSFALHAPYTASITLIKKTVEYVHSNCSILSIHNQENQAESDFFTGNSNAMREVFDFAGINIDFWKPTGVNSLRSTLPRFPHHPRLLLVHNTFTTIDDIRYAKILYNNNSQTSNIPMVTGQVKHQTDNALYWCFCPNANLFIENRLPDYDAFIKENCNITIGTDSLASNNSLSILDEMKTISLHAPHIGFEKLLQWATVNGAEFLKFDKEFGTLEKGKKPGINLLRNVDVERQMLKLVSEVVKLA